MPPVSCREPYLRPKHGVGSGHAVTQAIGLMVWWKTCCSRSSTQQPPTTAGWRYLAIWVDLYSRRVIGWAMGSSMEATLVLEALNRALGHRQIAPDQLLIHTDQGSQYRATAYKQMLEGRKISCSMSARGCCWDNAVVESFFSTLKHELDLDDDAKTLLSPHQLLRQLAFWIDGYYNRERRHSTIGYLSPIDYELRFIESSKIKPVST